MKDQEQLSKRHKDIVRFIIIARLFDFQYPTFYKDLKQEMKRRMNIFTGSLNAVLNLLKTNLPPEYEEYLDNNAAGAWEVLEEYDKAEDKAMFLTMCKCFNEGMIMDQTTRKPINEKGFAEVLKPKAA